MNAIAPETRSRSLASARHARPERSCWVGWRRPPRLVHLRCGADEQHPCDALGQRSPQPRNGPQQPCSRPRKKSIPCGLTDAADVRTPAPLAVRDVVVFGSAAGGLAALRVTDGKQKWTTSLYSPPMPLRPTHLHVLGKGLRLVHVLGRRQSRLRRARRLRRRPPRQALIRPSGVRNPAWEVGPPALAFAKVPSMRERVGTPRACPPPNSFVRLSVPRRSSWRPSCRHPCSRRLPSQRLGRSA